MTQTSVVSCPRNQLSRRTGRRINNRDVPFSHSGHLKQGCQSPLDIQVERFLANVEPGRS